MKIKNKVLKAVFSIFLAAGVSTFVSLTSFALSKAKVTADSVFIRSAASTSGEIIAGAMKNDELDVISSEKDSQGNTWYKVYIDSTQTGYVRADLVSVDGAVTQAETSQDTQTSTDTTTTTDDTGSDAAVTPVEATQNLTGLLESSTEVEPVGAQTTGDVRVRKGPSTSTEVVTNATKGTAAVVYGYENASDGIWYYVEYMGNSSQVKGYIRSDFVKLDGELVEKTSEAETEPQQEAEPEPEPEPEPEETIYYDYEVVYELDENGDAIWYLNDYIEGTKNEITSLIESKEKYEEYKASSEKEIKGKKRLNVILIIIIILLLLAAGFAYYRFRVWYFGYDESEEAEKKDVSQKSNTLRQTQTKEERSTKTSNESRSQTSRGGDFKIETVGSENSQKKSSLPDGGVRLSDGRIMMPDGTIKKAVMGVRLPDGSIKLQDGRIRKPDGTIIKPETSENEAADDETKPESGISSREEKTIPYTGQTKARNFISEDDDMEFGFLNMDSKGMDE